MAGDQRLERRTAAPRPADRVTPVTRPLGDGKCSRQHETPNEEPRRPSESGVGHLKALGYRRSDPDEGCFSSLVSDPWLTESTSCAVSLVGFGGCGSPVQPETKPIRQARKRHLSRSDIRFAFREEGGKTTGSEVQNTGDSPMRFSDRWQRHNLRQPRSDDTRCTCRLCR